MSIKPFQIATAQHGISSDVAENGKIIRALMGKASAAGARLVHFPEASLSGYCKSQILNWDDVDWAALDIELEKISDCANELSIWVVVGCNHKLPSPTRPHNSLYVIDNRGAFVARYDKRYCSHSEITSWYSPGSNPVVFDVDGMRFGCAICIEVNFPEIFADYEKLDVDCVLISSYSEDPMFGILAQAHASTNCYWVSFSVPSNCSDQLPSQFIGPTGDVVSKCEKSVDGLIVNELDKSDEKWLVPIQLARPWRRLARKGEIYERPVHQVQPK